VILGPKTSMMMMKVQPPDSRQALLRGVGTSGVGPDRIANANAPTGAVKSTAQNQAHRVARHGSGPAAISKKEHSTPASRNPPSHEGTRQPRMVDVM
jgi:hypothetical protein